MDRKKKPTTISVGPGTSLWIGNASSRTALSTHEDDALNLSKTEDSMTAAEQRNLILKMSRLILKMSRLTHPIVILAILSGVLLVASAGIWIWKVLRSFDSLPTLSASPSALKVYAPSVREVAENDAMDYLHMQRVRNLNACGAMALQTTTAPRCFFCHRCNRNQPHHFVGMAQRRELTSSTATHKQQGAPDSVVREAPGRKHNRAA